MRPRKWVLIVACIVLSLVIALFTGKRILEKSRNLENLLTGAVSSAIRGTCTVDAVRIGFFSVSLRNVTVTLPLQSVGITIGRIKAGISFSRLITYRGDLSRAINQIILIKPVIDLPLSLPGNTPTPQGKTTAGRQQGRKLTEPPVRFLFVKNGTVRLNNRQGDTTLVAGHLSGNLTSHLDEVAFTLSGRAGSSKKNLSVQGTLSWPRNRHYLSVRLSDARLGEPFSTGSFTLNSGLLNGTVECTFNNRFDPDSLELHGSVRFSEGNVRLHTPDLTLDSLLTGISFDKGVCSIDTFSGNVRGMRCTTRGTVRCTSRPAVDLSVVCNRMIPDSVADLLPPDARTLLSGNGRAAAELHWEKDGEPTIALTASGFTLGTLPLQRISVNGRLSGSTLIADTFLVATPYGAFDLQGHYNLDSTKNSYDLSFIFTSDSLPDTLGVTGDLRAMGTVTGSAMNTPVVSCRLESRNLSYRNISLGNPQLIIQLKEKHCTFSSVGIDSVTPVIISGSIDSVFSTAPFARISASVRSGPINDQLMRIHGMPKFDTFSLTADATGWMNRFTAAANLTVRSRDFGGTLHGHLERSPDDTGAFIWNLRAEKAHYKEVPVSFSGKGRLLDTCILIDTLAACDNIHGSAAIFHTLQPPLLNARLNYTMPIEKCLRFFSSGENSLTRGSVRGTTTISGPFDDLATRSTVELRDAGTEALNGFSTNLTVSSRGTDVTILPGTLMRDRFTLLSFDTISTKNGRLQFRGSFTDVTPQMLAGTLLPPDLTVKAMIHGEAHTTDSGFPMAFTFSAPAVRIDTIMLDSVRCSGTITPEGLTVSRLTFKDGKRTDGTANGYLPWALLGSTTGEHDTLRGAVQLRGDLLATIERNAPTPIGGNGQGTADIAFFATGGSWTFTRGDISLPRGVLTVSPFVPDKVKNFTFHMSIDSSGTVHTDMNGTIKRKPIRIVSTHTLPGGYAPLIVGPLDLGAFQVETPKKGVDLHLPGFMALHERGGIEFQGRGPFRQFTISGPLERLKLTGTWVLRDLEFTFPFLPFREMDWNFDPFPYVTWEMDLKPGNRKAMYFWDLAGKRGRILRFVEGYLDLSSRIRVRGRDLDKTFRIYGAIRSYKGAVYYGRVFDRNFNVGVEFNPLKPKKNAGYDNFPLLWGSAEAFADTSRLDRIKLTCMVVDPVTGAISEKGRLADQPTPNITFHLSSDIEELPGERERDYYRQAGLTFTTISGAGSAVSNFGEQLFHRYLLQRWERKLARKLGLDVMNIESSIVSNYFSKLYSRQFDGVLNEDDYLALANVGVTVGRYFFRDFLLVKARGELIPIEMQLTPEYSIGFEFQPSQYLTMDLNYGFHMSDAAIQHSPLLMMQLRLPITRLRNLLHF